MSLARKPATRMVLAGVAALAGLAAADAAQAQAVVVRSTGPSATAYPQGKKLPANAKVTLKAGDKLTVLDKAGTRVLAGPGSFTLDNTVARDQGAASRVTGVLAAGGQARTRTGAVRGAPMAAGTATVPAGPDSIWYVDVSKGGTYCVADPASLVLWRPNRAEEATAKLSDASGKTAPIVWRKGNSLKQWPTAQLPVVEGGIYRFSHPVGPTVTITTRLLGAVAGDDLTVAGLLADKGCNAQLDVFANSAAPAAPSGGR